MYECSAYGCDDDRCYYRLDDSVKGYNAHNDAHNLICGFLKGIGISVLVEDIDTAHYEKCIGESARKARIDVADSSGCLLICYEVEQNKERYGYQCTDDAAGNLVDAVDPADEIGSDGDADDDAGQSINDDLTDLALILYKPLNENEYKVGNNTYEYSRNEADIDASRDTGPAELIESEHRRENECRCSRCLKGVVDKACESE